MLTTVPNNQDRIGTVNPITGLLTKAADTALDIYTLKATGGSGRVIGSSAPAGDGTSDPAKELSAKPTVTNKQVEAPAVLEKKQESNTQLYMGLAVVGVSLAVLVIATRGKK